MDLKVDEVKPRLDKNGNIRKNDFIEFSIENKLLDLSERKTSNETPKKGSKVILWHYDKVTLNPEIMTHKVTLYPDIMKLMVTLNY